MALRDPADRRLLQFAERRYRARCDSDARMLVRADSMREINRIANQPLPPELFNSEYAIDIRQQLVAVAEERVRDRVHEQLAAWIKAEPEFRDKLRAHFDADWTNLNGALAPMRVWAVTRLQAVQQGNAIGES